MTGGGDASGDESGRENVSPPLSPKVSQQLKVRKKKPARQWQVDPLQMQQAFDTLRLASERREKNSDEEKQDPSLIAPPLPTVLPKILSNVSEQLFLPSIRSFTDTCHSWPRLVTQVSQGFAQCASFGEYLVEIGSPPPTSPDQPPSDGLARLSSAVGSALASLHTERQRAYQVQKILAEQVGKPLLKFTQEARSQFMALVTEEQNATKSLETLVNQVTDQKVKCMLVWEDLRSWDGKGKAPSSIVAGVLKRYSTVPASLEQAYKDFANYEILLKRLNGFQVRYIREMDRMLLALEGIEKGRLQALYDALRTLHSLRQESVTLPTPAEQMTQYLATFEPSEFRRLRFSAMAYDLPCSADDLKEGVFISSSETIAKVSADVALGSFDVPTINPKITPPPPPPFSRASAIAPAAKAASPIPSPPPIPPSLPEMNEEERRTHVGRMLLNEADAEMPKLHTEESDQSGSGYLELMANSLNTSTLASTWKTLYCTVRASRLLISTRKGESSLFASYYLRAARFVRYGPLDVKGRPHCFSIYFPHSNQRVVFAAKTEMGVIDWLQALTRAAVTTNGVLGRSLIMPALALAEINDNVKERLDTIEKSLVWFREYAAFNTGPAPLASRNNDESGDEGEAELSPARGSHAILWKESQLSVAVRQAYTRAEMSGYLDRLLVGWVEHEPYLGLGSHYHWDLMASVNRKYWLILKIFLLGGPSVLRVVKPAMNKNVDRLAKVIVNIGNFLGVTSELVDTFIYHEVANTQREAQLFRTDSLTTKMLSYFSAIEGKSYVYKLLAKPVHACVLDACDKGVSFELDASKIDLQERKIAATMTHSRSSSGAWWFGRKGSEEDTGGMVRRRSSASSNLPDPDERPRRASSPSVPPTPTNATVSPPPPILSVAAPLPPLFLADRLADVEHAWFLGQKQGYEETKITMKVPSEDLSSKEAVKVKPLTHSITQHEGIRAVLLTNQMNLEQALQLFVNEIIRSLEYCPRALRVAAHSVQRAVGEAFPGNKWSAVGGFYFLRFLVPQIILVPWAPEAAATPPARRNLLVITKVLQILANCANADGGSREHITALLAAKESSIQSMTGFVLQNVDRISKFLTDLASPPLLEEQAKELEPDLEWFFVNVLATLDCPDH